MATDGKSDGTSSKTVSRMGIGMLSGDLPQPMLESVGQSMSTPFYGLTPFPKATSEALNFLESIDENDLRYLLFEDTLAIVTSETGKVVGEFQMMVSFGGGKRHPMLTVKANSVGTIDSVPCGTSITARLTPQLETLEQRIHEYVKLDGYLLDRVTDVIKERENYAIYRMVTKGEKQEKTEYSAGTINMRGFISEGANLLLQKLFLKKGVPENCQLLTMDYDSTICPVVYKSLGQKTEKIGDSEVKVRGIERFVKTSREQPIIWHSFYNDECHLLTRAQLDAPVSMKNMSPLARSNDEVMSLTSVAPGDAAVKKGLDWENDMQLYSKYLDRKEQLIASHMTYINHNESIRQLMADFLQALLLQKPKDVVAFAGQYFSYHAHETPEEVFQGPRRERSASLSYSNPVGLAKQSTAQSDQ